MRVGDHESHVHLRRPPIPGRGERWALLLDIDGTLVEFAQHPDDVHLPPGLQSLLERLRLGLTNAVGILSGRTLADVDRLLAPLIFPVVALHGAEQRYPSGELTVLSPPAAIADSTRRACAAALDRWPGAFMESKSGFGFALHFRAAPEHGSAVRQFVETIALKSGGNYEVQFGDCVAELKPAGRSKGSGLLALAAKPPFVGRLPIVLGDDLTDESAFEQAEALGGFGVIVGPRRPTSARFSLSGPAATQAWLHSLANHLELEVKDPA